MIGSFLTRMREPRTFLQLVKTVIRKRLNNLSEEVRQKRLSVSTPVLDSEERNQKKKIFKKKYYSQKIRSRVSDKKMIYRKRKHYNSCPNLVREVGMLDYLDIDTWHMFQDTEESEEHPELLEIYLE